MAESPFIFAPGFGRDAYVVTRRSDGVELGEVRKYIEHFNLRRPVTVHGWRAFPTERSLHKLGEYRTRAQAAEALSAHTDAAEQWDEDDTDPAELHPCTHGHFDCSIFEGGPCGDEERAARIAQQARNNDTGGYGG